MALKVIGAGFGRTGTLSLKTALEQLGYSKCHHMQEVISDREQLDAWLDISLGGKPDWDPLFEPFVASVDWPSCTFWDDLTRHYPESKVILTLRDPDRWYDSVIETIYPSSTEVPAWLQKLVPRLGRFVRMADALIWTGTFQGRFEDRAHAIDVFQRNTNLVKASVAPERLLVFQATDGWEPLCEFLGVPVPDGPYPHVNEAASIKRLVRVIRALRWLPYVLAALAVLWLVL